MQPATFHEYSFRLATALAVIGFFLQGVAEAQITSDGTTNTQTQTDDNFIDITGGIEAGSNLFHSFEQFSVLERETANFEHNPQIEQIFGRVTGGTVSTIDGLIQTQGNASLFLLNPAGIVFGNNAQLNIGGSVVFSTGDRLIFADGTEFDAVTPKADSLLTVSIPVGIQYGGVGSSIEVLANNDPSTNTFDLSVYAGNTLALLGGNVSVSQNSLGVFGSNLEVASVESGTIALLPDEFGWRFDYPDVTQFGLIEFSDRANINIDGGGRVNFQGKEIDFSRTSGVLDFNQFSELKTKVNLTATELIKIDDGLVITQVGQDSGLIDGAITDAGGDIAIAAPQVLISNGSVISAGTLSEGDGGSIKISANDLRLFSELGQNPPIISTSTDASGAGGSIDIDTDRLTIANGSQIQALAATGSGGTITVNAREEIQLSGTGILRSQDIDGNISESKLASGFSASSGNKDEPVAEQSEFTGASGSLSIKTPTLTIKDSAEISVGSYGSANAGDIDIYTSQLNLDTTGQIVANTASNEGGSISVWAEQIILDRYSSISTTAASAGNGGNITLVTENLALLDTNRIVADAKVGNGGNIYIDAQGLFIDPNSSITASSQVKQNEGTVEISTLDLNSRLATDYSSPSLLVAEDEITSSCGVGINLNSNQIRDVGRGGIPHNPFRETANIEGLGDFGINLEQMPPINEAQIDLQQTLSVQPIIEVDRWVVNSHGRVELVANANNVEGVSISSCVGSIKR